MVNQFECFRASPSINCGLRPTRNKVNEIGKPRLSVSNAFGSYGCCGLSFLT